MKDKICCPLCNGFGSVSLAQAFRERAEALELLRDFGPMTATELQPRLSKRILVTGVNNRLEDLRALGFVTREKYGREWLYSAVSSNGIADAAST